MSEIQFSIRQALVHQTSQGQGRRGVLQAPVGGWNTRDNVAAMNPQYATQLTNFFPDRGRITSRKGHVLHAQCPTTDPIKTIHNHLASDEACLLACTDNAVYDISDPENIRTVFDSGVTNGRWRIVSHNRQSIGCNGVDEPFRIDQHCIARLHGFHADVGQPTLDTRKLDFPSVFKNRVFFAERGTANIWYGDLNAITGGLTQFPLGLVDERAGDIVSLGSISMDTGEGVDDLFVAFMARGQVIIYAGSDPGDLEDWRLAGVYHLGQVVGDKPTVKLGADLIAVTTDGYIPLTQFLRGGRAQTDLAVSNTIAPTVTQAIQAHHEEEGWQAVLYTPANWLLFNVPLGGGTFEQHVMHTQTAAWCKFTGMDAWCWETADDLIYFGTSLGRVMQANMGENDLGEPIEALARGAYNYFGSPYDKLFRMIRVHLETTLSRSEIGVGADVDFQNAVPSVVREAIQTRGTRWNTARWNIDKWSEGRIRSKQWRGLNEFGGAISMYLAANIHGAPLTWYSTDVLYDQATGALPVAQR